MLVYDHLLTLQEEVERIWKQKTSGATILFLINRYGTLLSFIVVLDAFHDPSWPRAVCDRFVMFEGAQTIVFVGICELIMILRVYALYGRSAIVLVFLMALWCAQIVMSGIGIHTGWAVPSPPDLNTGCILDGDNTLFLSLWVAPLVTDTFIFALTLWRIRRYKRRVRSTPLVQIFLRDGIMYFFAIFSANFLNFMIYVLAPSDLKPVGASFSQLLTSVMISRLVLNLRAVSNSPSTDHSTSQMSTGIYTYPVTKIQNMESSFMDYAIGNLGEDFDDSTERGAYSYWNMGQDDEMILNIRSVDSRRA
ncbi:hypothetical protein CVT24_004172 [Panaeolus cyanescens]|uniref:DUF6533 domain-containing protein n=1 Tax=Panaeolus cyanescens TaxID=181874 RepID=A0A409YXA4_9AGAR|nr:hypothetical protein CVT24_004172 [Panaeolus cyanescens]